ncbi:MAG: VTT domain-containing protein [Dehalococcoidia bacterium]
MSVTRTPQRQHEPQADDASATPQLLESSAEGPPTTRSPIWRLEYGLLLALVVMVTASAFAFFFFSVNLDQLNTYGYVGLFVISLISAASIVMPMPGAAAITSAGALLDPIFGIPVPILVGLIAGPAEALGELTGYAAGYGGSALFRDRSSFPRVRRWMERRGILTMFLLSSFPNPLVDVAGVAAGAVKMKLSRFFVGVLSGKIVKNIYLASGGLAAGEVLRHLFE